MTWSGTTPSKPKLQEGEEPPEGEDEEALADDEDAENPDRNEPLERGAVVEADWPRRIHGITFFDNKARYKQMKDVVLPEDPNYVELSNCEKLVVQSRKKGLATFVVSPGLLYGRGEGTLMHYLFKDAWELKPCPFPWDPTQPQYTAEELEAVSKAKEEEAAKKAAAEEAGEEYEPTFIPQLRGRGENMVPTIHVDDMAKVVANLVAAYPGPDCQYILAVDRSRCSLAQIVQAISTELGNGQTRELSEAETVQIQDVDKLQVDLVLQQSQALKGLLKWNKWKCRDGPIAGIETVLNEFRIARKVTPLKLFLHGPPGRGTELAKALAVRYKVRTVTSSDVIAEAVQLEPKKFGRAMKKAQKKTEGRLPDRVLCEMFRRVLTTQPCKNQGYILDGFPKTYTQAKWLTQGWKEHEPEEDEEEPPPEADPDYTYGHTRPPPSEDEPAEEEDEEEEEVPEQEEEEDEDAKEKRLAAELARVNKQCTAEFVFSINTSVSTIEAIAAKIPEMNLRKGHDDEAGIQRRLKLFQGSNQVGLDTAVSCFEDAKVAITNIIADNKSSEKIAAEITAVVGDPHNYGLTEEEKLAIQVAKEVKEKAEADQRAREKEAKDQEEQEKREAKIQAEKARKEQIASMDESTLLRAAMPLRKYLQTHVMAVVRRGLIECAEVRPNDPIDYLAEYLLENNPAVE